MTPDLIRVLPNAFLSGEGTESAEEKNYNKITCISLL